jgi:hypothetical protein
VNASNAKRNQGIGLDRLRKTLKQFNKHFSDEKALLIDVTEQIIQRPPNNEKQKRYYSGKKSAHPKSNGYCHTF